MSAKWTVMVYVAGYNSLTEFAGKDLAEMRKVRKALMAERPGRGKHQ